MATGFKVGTTDIDTLLVKNTEFSNSKVADKVKDNLAAATNASTLGGLTVANMRCSGCSWTCSTACKYACVSGCTGKCGSGCSTGCSTACTGCTGCGGTCASTSGA